jgi:hypothetical protein
MFNRGVERLKVEMDNHIKADMSMNQIGMHYFEPVDPPEWLHLGCSECDWNIRLGDMDKHDVIDACTEHANQHRRGDNVVIFPFMLL